jgi:hypothetical protein
MLTDVKVTIEELYKHVAAPPGDAVISELQKSLHWSVSEFENDGRWTFEPLTDSTIMPKEAWHRKELIDGTGIDVEWVVAHEIDYKPVTLPEIEINLSEEDRERLAKAVIITVGVLVFSWAIILLIPVILLGAICLAGAAGCLSGDPVLLAVTRNKKGDRVWVACYRWYDG